MDLCGQCLTLQLSMTNSSKFKKGRKNQLQAAESFTTKFQAIVSMIKSPVSTFRNKRGKNNNNKKNSFERLEEFIYYI